MSNHNSCDTVVSSNEHGAPNHSQRSRGTVSRQPPGLRGSRAHIRCGIEHISAVAPLRPICTSCTHIFASHPPRPPAPILGAAPTARQPGDSIASLMRRRRLQLALAPCCSPLPLLAEVTSTPTARACVDFAPPTAAAAAIPVAQVRHQLEMGIVTACLSDRRRGPRRVAHALPGRRHLDADRRGLGGLAALAPRRRRRRRRGR